jgi:GNAT superfamily N-acetyltransferase
MPSNVEIRAVLPADRDGWLPLYRAYADFYKVELTDENAATVWRWLHDPHHEVEGLVAVLDGALVGLAHFRRMPSPLRATDIGFLDDLYVAPAARGARAGEALIGAVADIARARGWPRLRWITADDNYRARTLYDRVAKKTAWNTYEIVL